MNHHRQSSPHRVMLCSEIAWYAMLKGSMLVSIKRRHFMSLALPLAVTRALRGMPVPIIKDVSVIPTEPAGVRLVVVKIQTDQDGLYGYGCATFTQRADLVVDAVTRYLKPLLIGRPTDAIEDLWEAMYNSSYWRNGPVLNNGISGVDQALWDIKGRQAGMPVYELLGGKCRRAAMIYSHASGREIPEAIDQARKLTGQGIKAVRLQVGVPGMAAYGAAQGAGQPSAAAAPQDDIFEPEPYVRRTLALFEAARKELGPAWNSFTMFMSDSRRGWRCSLPKTWSRSVCSISKMCCRLKTSTTSARFAPTARRRSRWASC